MEWETREPSSRVLVDVLGYRAPLADKEAADLFAQMGAIRREANEDGVNKFLLNRVSTQVIRKHEIKDAQECQVALDVIKEDLFDPSWLLWIEKNTIGGFADAHMCIDVTNALEEHRANKHEQ